MVCGLPLAIIPFAIKIYHPAIYHSDVHFWWWTIVSKGKEERFRRLKEFITRIPSAVDLCLPCHWCDEEDSLQQGNLCKSWEFESSSCLIFIIFHGWTKPKNQLIVVENLQGHQNTGIPRLYRPENYCIWWPTWPFRNFRFRFRGLCSMRSMPHSSNPRWFVDGAWVLQYSNLLFGWFKK